MIRVLRSRWLLVAAAAGVAAFLFFTTTGAFTPLDCPSPSPSPTPTQPMPLGVPADQVGALITNMTGAELYAAWHADPVNTWCGGGHAAPAGTNAVLTGTTTGGCADLGSPAAYKAGIYQATITTASLTGHPAFWMSGFSNVQGAGAWTANGEIDAAEAPNSGCWEIFYHAHGATNAYASGCLEKTAGTYTVTIVRHPDGTCDIYYQGVKEASFPTDVANGEPTPLLVMFDTSGTATPLVINQFTVWNTT